MTRNQTWTAGLSVLVLATLAAWLIPRYQVVGLQWERAPSIQQLELIDAYRTTVLLFLGGVGLIIIAYLRVAATERSAAAALDNSQAAFQAAMASQESTRLQEQGQVTERFTRAIQQLGDKKLEIRLGGIYALERIARDSRNDHWTVMEVLTAFVREHRNPERTQQAEVKGRPPDEAAVGEIPADIQAALVVIGRRSLSHEEDDPRVLDLQRTDLRRANLARAHLERANLMGAQLLWATLSEAHLEQASLAQAQLRRARMGGAHLERATLILANLEKATLENAHLEGADLQKACLEKALLVGAHLGGAFLQEAKLESAILLEADLEGAVLEGAQLMKAHLGRAHLEGAHLERANLEGAVLQGTCLEGAHLEGTNLLAVIGLTQAQVDSIASWDEHTEFPQGLTPPSRDPERETQ